VNEEIRRRIVGLDAQHAPLASNLGLDCSLVHPASTSTGATRSFDRVDHADNLGASSGMGTGIDQRSPVTSSTGGMTFDGHAHRRSVLVISINLIRPESRRSRTRAV